MAGILSYEPAFDRKIAENSSQSLKRDRRPSFPSSKWTKILGTLVCIHYCAFHKHANSEVQKPTDDCVFRCRQSSLRTSQKTKLYFNGFKRSRFVIFDWWISIRFVCLCVSRFVACDRNYETAAKNVIVNVHSEVLQI